MRIAVISDTHDNISVIRKTIDKLKDQNIQKIIHCGDMVSPFSAELFKQLNKEFCYVEGNNDGEAKLKETIEEFGTYYQDVAVMDIEGKKVAVYHGTNETIVESLAKSEKYDYVFRGHTHKKSDKKISETRIINPGGIKLPETGQEEFTFAIIDLEKDDLEFHNPE